MMEGIEKLDLDKDSPFRKEDLEYGEENDEEEEAGDTM